MSFSSSLIVRATCLALPLFLTACSSEHGVSLVETQHPIVNIESSIANQIAVNAAKKNIQFTNLTDTAIQLKYGLFWYDKQGVTQLALSQLSPAFYPLQLSSKQQKTLKLTPPTVNSVSYRLVVMPAQSN